MNYEIGDIIQWVWGEEEGGSARDMNPILVLGEGMNKDYYLALDLVDGVISNDLWSKWSSAGHWEKVA